LLLRQGPALMASAEDAFVDAITIAKHQGARSYQLLASLSLAKHYLATDRLDEAREVLGPALEELSPTAEMPEIADARALETSLEPRTTRPRR
jgi:predicted negative regulator of RcsB-dependent stress response